MLKLRSPPFNSQAVEAVTLRARTRRGGVFPATNTTIQQMLPDTIQELQFVKVVIMCATSPPFGPRAVQLEDWLSDKTAVVAYVCPPPGFLGRYEVDQTAGLTLRRDSLVPVPARTTAEDVERASSIVLESSKARALRKQMKQLEQKHIALKAANHKYITNWALALLTGRLPSRQLRS